MARATRSLLPARRKHSAPLSPEILWFLEDRGYGLPSCVPKFRTPEPRSVRGAMFDPAEVDRVIAALGHLRHTKGKWAGRPIVPTAEQVAYFIAPVFGWRQKNRDGRMVRIIREAFFDQPRKSAKTTLSSAFAMLLAFADGEPGAEVYLGAASKDQARAAFDPLKAVADQSVTLREAGVRTLRGEIRQDVTQSLVQVVSSRGDLAHGKNVHGGLIDELHDLVEAIESGTGAREQPLVIIITTADDGKTDTVYAQRRELIEKVAKRTIKAPAMYGVVFAADDGDDPFADATWAKANPLYPVTPSREFMVAAADKARSGPVQLASFKRLHLGIRSKLAATFFDLDKWDLNVSIVDEDALAGRVAFGGVDLAATSDITALGWLLPGDDGGFDVLCRFWLPEAAIERLDARTHRTASGWVENGWLTLTPGDVTDYEFIHAQIEADLSVFDVQGIGFDPWNATQVMSSLIEDGAPVEQVRQGPQSLSAPLKEIDRLIRAGTSKAPLFRHGGNPVLRWMADNLRPRVDANENIAPDKARSMDKIDGISALCNAMFVALHAPEPGVAGPGPLVRRGITRTHKVATMNF